MRCDGSALDGPAAPAVRGTCRGNPLQPPHHKPSNGAHFSMSRRRPGKGAVAVSDIVQGEGDRRETNNAIIGAVVPLVGLPGKLIADMVTRTQAWLEGDAPPSVIVLGSPKK